MAPRIAGEDEPGSRLPFGGNLESLEAHEVEAYVVSTLP